MKIQCYVILLLLPLYLQQKTYVVKNNRYFSEANEKGDYYKKELEIIIGTPNSIKKVIPNMVGNLTYIFQVNVTNYTKIIESGREFELRKERIYNDKGEVLSDNFHFWTNYIYNYINQLALARTFNDNCQSLTHVFYNQKAIEHLCYGIQLENKNDMMNNNSLLHFGGLPQDKINGLYTSHCNTIKSSYKWACEIIKVLFNGDVYTNRAIVYFDFFGRDFVVPETFVTFIEYNFFMKLLENDICQKVRGRFNIFEKEYLCIDDSIKNFPKIEFVFENFVISLKDEIIIDNNSILFKTENNHKWVFNGLIIKKYSFLFDYENDIVSIYSDEPINLSEIRNINIDISIINIIIIFLGIFIIIRYALF